jgi:hypothetical protein
VSARRTTPEQKLGTLIRMLASERDYDAGARAVENKQHGPGDFHNVDSTPDWNEIALFCQRSSHRLSQREPEFIKDMASKTVWREPTERQSQVAASIFYRLGGRI